MSRNKLGQAIGHMISLEVELASVKTDIEHYILEHPRECRHLFSFDWAKIKREVTGPNSKPRK